MKVLFCLLILLASNSVFGQSDQGGPSIQIGGKAYVRFVAENLGDTAKVGSSYISLLTLGQLFTNEYEIFSDTTFFLTFDAAVPTTYDLFLKKDVKIPIFIVPGDTLTIRADYQKNKGAPNIIFEGLYSPINRYLVDKPRSIAFSKENAALFNDPYSLKTPEKSLLLYKRKSDSLVTVQQAYVTAKADSYKLPSWFVEFEKVESILFARYHQLLIVDYWKMFYDVDFEVPDGYFKSIESVDISNPNAKYSVYYSLYLPVVLTMTPDFVQYKSRLLDSCGVKSIDDLKTTQAYATYYLKRAIYVSDKANDVLPEESLPAFLTNHFFHMMRVLDRAGTKQLLDHIKPKLEDTKIWPFLLQTYEEMSTHLSRGQSAPRFYLLSADADKYLSLDDFKGKVVLLNFWFPGCRPCILEIPHEKKLMKKYGDQGFVVINICMEATVHQWQMALKKYDLQGVNVVTQGNWERKLKEAYAVDVFPHYALVDQEGKIVENQTLRPSDPRLAELIEVTLRK